MAPPSSHSLNLHFDVLPPQTRQAFEFLTNANWLKNSTWYLAGGTALALQVGHRQSVDLDFFTTAKSFDTVTLLSHFGGIESWKTDIERENTVHGELFGAKVSFIAYPFFAPAERLLLEGAIRILTPPDIAVMKIIAVSQRGRKRDFVDLYWFFRNGSDLEALLRRVKQQYPFVAHDYHHILKSLVYFDDAEQDPMPETLFPVSWNEIKAFFMQEVPAAAKSLVELE